MGRRAARQIHPGYRLHHAVRKRRLESDTGTRNDGIAWDSLDSPGPPWTTVDHLEYLDYLDNLDYTQCVNKFDVFDPDAAGSSCPVLRESLAKLEVAVNFDFVRRVGQKYFVSNKQRGSFSTAVDFCSQRGLELALPQNEEENSVLTQVFGDVHKTAWINVNNNKAEGNFEADLKNRPLTFTKWGEGQPDRSIQDTGCTMLSENSVWRVTRECSLDAFIICQI
ncbi:hypothetical protein L3Q82_023693 [Scortum barcoo]|uniref:Uncharacterized protein n=1 Tax=Scortum barcoo TaxID=214431 RepID=A0ACB8WT85_9TELE|nr:hypothetical protein L3Q82_023693 [Scortum barcoo]